MCPFFFQRSLCVLDMNEKNVFRGGLVVMFKQRHLDALSRRCHGESSFFFFCWSWESQVESSEKKT